MLQKHSIGLHSICKVSQHRPTDSHEHASGQGRAEAGSALLGQGPLQGVAHKGEDGHGAHALPLCWQGACTDPTPIMPLRKLSRRSNSALPNRHRPGNKQHTA